MKLVSIAVLLYFLGVAAAASSDKNTDKTGENTIKSGAGCSKSRQVGVTSPKEDPVEVKEQRGRHVTFEVTKKWDTEIDYLFVQYSDPDTGLPTCEIFKDVTKNFGVDVDSRCMSNVPISVVTVVAVDDSFSDKDVAAIPACCGDGTILGEVPTKAKTASYTFILDCVSAYSTSDAGTSSYSSAFGSSSSKSSSSSSGGKKVVTTKHTVEVKDGDELLEATCGCGDKSVDIDGGGFVTGGGWIYLDPEDTYVNEDFVGVASFPADTKANFGFNAKDKKGVPGGSTNFVIDGNAFHFHSATSSGTPYEFLEVPDSIHARWWGTGHLSTALIPDDATDKFSFMVAVQDWGEPGADDTWRIRIWETDKPENVVFDNKKDAPLQDDTTTDDGRFSGTELGELDANGGGNIQIHKSKKGRVVMLESDANCVCDIEEKIKPSDACGGAFVTGGGWVYLADAMRNTTRTVEKLNDIIKANFGFNAKFKKNDMVPDGSTNFDYEGNGFHFHSETGGKSKYDFLEIPCPTEARWMGKGTLSLTARRMLGHDDDDDIVYGFMVAVQDNGEPGSSDTWRLRIWNPADGDLDWEDSNPVVPASYVFDTNPEFPTGYDDEYRFLGTELGELDSNGGGNVQIHWKKE